VEKSSKRKTKGGRLNETTGLSPSANYAIVVNVMQM